MSFQLADNIIGRDIVLCQREVNLNEINPAADLWCVVVCFYRIGHHMVYIPITSMKSTPESFPFKHSVVRYIAALC